MKVKLDQRTNNSLDFNSITARTFAENITYLDWKGISKIKVNDCLDRTLMVVLIEYESIDDHDSSL